MLLLGLDHLGVRTLHLLDPIEQLPDALDAHRAWQAAGTAITVENASSLVYAGEQTSNIFTCAEQVRILVQEMREGVQAFDVIIVITREAIKVTLARNTQVPARPNAGDFAGQEIRDTQLHSEAARSRH